MLPLIYLRYLPPAMLLSPTSQPHHTLTFPSPVSQPHHTLIFPSPTSQPYHTLAFPSPTSPLTQLPTHSPQLHPNPPYLHPNLLHLHPSPPQLHPNTPFHCPASSFTRLFTHMRPKLTRTLNHSLIGSLTQHHTHTYPVALRTRR